MISVAQIAKNARAASIILSTLEEEVKNNALKNIAQNLEKDKKLIFEANEKDLEAAKVDVEWGKMSKAMFGRLKLDEAKMNTMIEGIYDVIKLPDPVNQIMAQTQLDEGLILNKISTPIGVIGVIFEARPDVIAQISSLCVKSANAVILKGGTEAKYTNEQIAKSINEALDKTEGFPINVINQIYTREDVTKMLEMDGFIDLIIPRGSNELVKHIKENTRIPVMGHADGVCHIYIDESAEFEMALKICVDAKTQYPAVCNSVETVLINKNINFSQELIQKFIENDIEIIMNPEYWHFEYGDKKLSLKYVENLEEAINHINTYGSGHTDAIITQNKENAKTFMKRVDSANVFHNASTRFSDGFRYGFGAEVGVSTNKTHARGPVGLVGLTIYKYLLEGNGQSVGEYASGQKSFEHKRII